jgi:hypothetical protein
MVKSKRGMDSHMPSEFEEEWRNALDAYRSAIADYNEVIAVLDFELSSGVTPSESQIAREELARSDLVKARSELFRLLRERTARGN